MAYRYRTMKKKMIYFRPFGVRLSLVIQKPFPPKGVCLYRSTHRHLSPGEKSSGSRINTPAKNGDCGCGGGIEGVGTCVGGLGGIGSGLGGGGGGDSLDGIGKEAYLLLQPIPDEALSTKGGGSTNYSIRNSK